MKKRRRRTDAEFKTKVLRHLDSIEQRLETVGQRIRVIETDMHTIKSVLEISEKIENLLAELDDRSASDSSTTPTGTGDEALENGNAPIRLPGD